MTYAPAAHNVRPHESHRFLGGRCARCGTSPRWPIAESECPLRTYEAEKPKWTTKRTAERMAQVFDLLDNGTSIRETARIVGVDKKTIRRYQRLRANEG